MSIDSHRRVSPSSSMYGTVIGACAPDLIAGSVVCSDSAKVSKALRDSIRVR